MTSFVEQRLCPPGRECAECTETRRLLAKYGSFEKMTEAVMRQYRERDCVDEELRRNG